MTHLDPDLERLGDALRASIAIDLTRDEQAVRSTSDGRGRHGAGARTGWSCLHPRALAGGTLGFAGIGVTLVLALSAGGATAPSAFAGTKHSDGSVLVQLDRQEDLGHANQKLTDMGTHEQITLYLRPGPAAASGPVSCTPGPGAGPPNPPVQVVVGTDGSSSGQSAGNTGEDISNLICIVGPHTYTGPYQATAGNAGAG
jgi:hypothetical protein